MGRHGFFTAEQLATRFGLLPRMLEYYVSLGLLLPIKLHDGVFYTAGDFMRLEVIEKGKRLGFTLTEIKSIMDGVRRPDHEPPAVSG